MKERMNEDFHDWFQTASAPLLIFHKQFKTLDSLQTSAAKHTSLRHTHTRKRTQTASFHKVAALKFLKPAGLNLVAKKHQSVLGSLECRRAWRGGEGF